MDVVNVTCPSELDVAHTETFRGALLEISPMGSVELDGAHVARIDGAGLQLLVAFILRLQAEGRAWAWSGRSETLEAGARWLGVAAMLGIESEEHE